MTSTTLNMLTVSEFCEEIGISRSTWHKLKRQGKTPAIINIGGIQRIRREAIETWLSENETQATSCHDGLSQDIMREPIPGKFPNDFGKI